MGDKIEELNKLLGDLIEELKKKKKTGFIDQLLRERELYDELKATGLTITLEEPRERARIRPKGVLSLVEKLIVQWYDRNPISKSDWYGAGITPYEEIERISYTCPANKIAMIELLGAKTMRITVADSLATVFVRWYHQYDEESKPLIDVMLRNNTIGAIAHETIGTTLILTQGQKLSGTTEDTCEGGSTYCFLNYKVTEFDV